MASTTSRPLLEVETSVRRAIALALEDGGVNTVFALPGGHTAPIIDALDDPARAVRVVSVREESLGGIMAQVYGRLTGRPAVVIGQGAFILGAASGILEAHLSGTPMLVITDTSVEARFAHLGAYQSGSGDYGSWDTVAAYKAISTQVLVARSGSQSVEAVQRGLVHAVTEPGCATVVITLDALRGRVGAESVPALFRTGPPARPLAPADPAAIGAALELLVAAERPVIVAGGGVVAAGASVELLALAEQLALPVVTTAGGKGAVPETHPLALGPMGTFGTPAANAAVAAADVILVVGSKLAPQDTANHNPALIDPARQTLIQLDADPRHIGWTRAVALALVGDAAITLSVLGRLAADADLPPKVRDARQAAVAACAEDHPRSPPAPGPDEDRIMPQAVAAALEHALPNDAIICCDAGENRIFTMHCFRTPTIGSFLQPSGVGAMGYAIPAALAAKLVYPDRAAVAVCGDGGFGMTLNGLMTAIEEDLPIVVVIMNNQSLGWARHGGVGVSEYADFDLSAIAESMGCRGVRVDREEHLAPAIANAVASGRTVVLDVRVSREASYQDIESPLAKY